MRLTLARRLSDEIVKGIVSDVAVRKIRASGATERPGKADELSRHIAGERTKWGGVIPSAQLESQ